MIQKRHHILDQARVLFVDDDEKATRALITSLKRRNPNLEFLTATNPDSAKETIAQERPEACVLDLSLDPRICPKSGLALLPQLLELDDTLRILVLTGHDSEEHGIHALQMGAASFLIKPVESDHLLALLRDAISFSQLKRRYFRLSSTDLNFALQTGISTKSKKMLPVLESIAYAATNKQPILLVGETGVGKGVVAQAIHRAGRSASAPYIRFQPNFAGGDLVSSELFGHQKGAFTGATENRRGLIEEADGGTLFIDEVDELPPETQVLLLHVLQEKTFRRLGSPREQNSNFRLISATNQPVEQSLKKGKFRSDFYHRIAHFVIEIPPLRERREDLPDLAAYFVTQLTTKENLPIQGITPDAIAKLQQSDWPGNVRELQAVIEGAVYQANFRRRRFIETSDIRLGKRKRLPDGNLLSFRERVEQFERQIIEEALERHRGNQSQAAAALALDRSTLRRILKRS